ncbi:FAD-dependent oxidoreductase [Longirhabdus pacifica]|uniref:FAD-dependent oxidoreductase n=1 Tax=Longirhabdus pacifica TaxID=2305227 RepID=UPI0013E8D541|nr:FAD-dependent oxidoreductase [Longirhabdus pacifica]
MKVILRKPTTIIALLVVFAIAVFGFVYLNESGVFSDNDPTPTDEEKQLVENYVYPEALPSLADAYECIVVGGEPEGVAAAVSAARNGCDTLLVEPRDRLGGLMTVAMLNFLDLPQDKDGKLLSEGIFTEWHNMVGGGSAFDIELAEAAFLKLIQDEENITLALETTLVDVHFSEEDGAILNAITLQNEEGTKKITGQRFIDATQDADLAAMAGVPYFVGNEDLNLNDEQMAVTPMIHLKNVDWEKVRDKSNQDVLGGYEATGDAAWGYGELHHVYEEKEADTHLRGLNVARTMDSEGTEHFYINALQVFGVDGLDEASKQEGLERGIREIDHIVTYFQENIPGFENAEIASYPTEMYIRETRHILAEYQLPMSDIWRNKDHWDSIAIGGYPVDVQSTSPENQGYVISSPDRYAIPFRSTVPVEVDQLLVVSRSAGYSSLAAGTTRMIPTGMNVAQAGGLAAKLSMDENITFREMSKDETLIQQLRETLMEQGAYIDQFTVDYPFEGEWNDDALTNLINIGVIVGGYTNERFAVEEEASPGRMFNVLGNGLKRLDVEEDVSPMIEMVQQLYGTYTEETLLRDDMATILIKLHDAELSLEEDVWQQAVDLELVDNIIVDRLDSNRIVTNGEVYYTLNLLFQSVLQS